MAIITRENKHVWITKYALSSGIFENDVEVCSAINPNMVSTVGSKGGWERCFHKPFWYESLKEANAHAETMRKARIASLKKQIAKMEKMKF